MSGSAPRNDKQVVDISWREMRSNLMVNLETPSTRAFVLGCGMNTDGCAFLALGLVRSLLSRLRPRGSVL